MSKKSILPTPYSFFRHWAFEWVPIALRTNRNVPVFYYWQQGNNVWIVYPKQNAWLINCNDKQLLRAFFSPTEAMKWVEENTAYFNGDSATP